MASKRDLSEGNCNATEDEDPVPEKKMRCGDNIEVNIANQPLEDTEDFSQHPKLEMSEQDIASSVSNRDEPSDLQSGEEVVLNVEGANEETNAGTVEYCAQNKTTESYPTVELFESDQSSQHDSVSGDSLLEFAGHCESHVETADSVTNSNRGTADSNESTTSRIESNKESSVDSQPEVVFGSNESSCRVEVDSGDSNMEFARIPSQGSTSKPYNSIDASIDRVVKNYSDESNQMVGDCDNSKEQVVIDISSDSEVTDTSSCDQPKVIDDPKKAVHRYIRILPRIPLSVAKGNVGKSLLKAKNLLPIESHSTIVPPIKFMESESTSAVFKLVPNPNVAKSMPSFTVRMVPSIKKAPQLLPKIQIPSASVSQSAPIVTVGASNVNSFVVSAPSKRFGVSEASAPTNEKSSTHHQPRAQTIKSIPAAVTPSSDDSGLLNLGDGGLVDKLVNCRLTGSALTNKMRARLLKNGRICPKLDMGKDNEANQHVLWTSEYCYKTIPWLSGSGKLNHLFCWPCLLYGTTPVDNWNPREYSRATFTLVTDRHEITSEHLEACVRMKTNEMKIKMGSSKSAHNYNELVRKNRHFFKLLVEVVCTVKKKLNNMYTSHADCVELLNLISCYDGDLKDYLLEKSQKSKNGAADLVSSYVGGVLASVENRIRSKIKSELDEAPFVCLILEDTSDVVDKSWIAVIVRYVSRNGEICERFAKFVELSYERKPADVIPIFKNIVSELNCGEKLVGFTYGGTFVEPPKTAMFNEEISSEYPSARFFHYKEHNLRNVICQALSHLKYTRGFFQCISDLAYFFNSTPNAVKTFIAVDKDVFCDRPSPKIFDFSSGFILTLKDHYVSIAKFLMRIIAWPSDWTNEATVQAPYFLSFLRKVQNRFFIVLLAKIFWAVDPLTEAMEDKMDVDEWKLLAKRATVNLFQIKNHGFDEITEIASSNSLAEGSVSDSTISSKIKSAVYRTTFYEIIYFVATVINCRNREAELSFITLHSVISNAEDEEDDSKKQVLNRVLANMKIDNISKLKAQIKFYLRNNLFKNKSISESIQCINEFKLSDDMPDLHKFLQLLITVPMISSDTYSNPTVTRVKTYVRGKTELNSVDALMWIEKKMIEKLQEDRQFYEDVIDVFVKHYGVKDSIYSKPAERDSS